MADPVILDASETHPCAQCAGARQVAEMSWRAPAFSVTCLGCNQVIAGESADDAILAWNEVNPDREVDTEEQDAMRQRQGKALVTGFSFLDTVEELAEVYADTPSAAVIVAFLQWCQAHAQ